MSVIIFPSFSMVSAKDTVVRQMAHLEDKMIVQMYDGYEEETDVKEEPVGLTFGPVFDIGGPEEYFFLSHPYFGKESKRKKSPESYERR